MSHRQEAEALLDAAERMAYERMVRRQEQAWWPLDLQETRATVTVYSQFYGATPRVADPMYTYSRTYWEPPINGPQRIQEPRAYNSKPGLPAREQVLRELVADLELQEIRNDGRAYYVESARDDWLQESRPVSAEARERARAFEP